MVVPCKPELHARKGCHPVQTGGNIWLDPKRTSPYEFYQFWTAFIHGDEALADPKYNQFVNLEEEVNQKESQIETQLQRRGDLIPNLVSTVQGYASHEEEIFTDIADARSRLSGAGNVEEMAEANNEMTSALSRLLAISENYPERGG